MKQWGWLLVLSVTVTHAWCGTKKITVAELTETLATLHKQNKSDADVAAALKQVELSEQLTRSAMNSLVDNVPGKESTEQIYVLEARSATLAPPAADIPTAAAPDAAAQKAMLDKTADYVNKTYAQLPALTVTKTTLRFQDNVEAAAPSSGIHGSATDASVGSGSVSPFQFVHYINATDAQISDDHGSEKLPAGDKTPWGANKMIALQEPDPSLVAVFQEAQEAGDIKWLRWEMLNGKQTAVYSFDVPKKKAHMAINVCCFPDVNQAGSVHFTSAATGSLNGGSGGGAKGNFQTTTNWHNYKTSVPYHGEFFVDPDSGIVMRMITIAELKPTEVVHQVDTRIDYAPVNVGGGKTLVLPVKTITNTEVVPNGDSGSAGKYSTRTTLFTSEYKNYEIGGTK